MIKNKKILFGGFLISLLTIITISTIYYHNKKPVKIKAQASDINKCEFESGFCRWRAPNKFTKDDFQVIIDGVTIHSDKIILLDDCDIFQPPKSDYNCYQVRYEYVNINHSCLVNYIVKIDNEIIVCAGKNDSCLSPTPTLHPTSSPIPIQSIMPSDFISPSEKKITTTPTESIESITIPVSPPDQSVTPTLPLYCPEFEVKTICQ